MIDTYADHDKPKTPDEQRRERQHEWQELSPFLRRTVRILRWLTADGKRARGASLVNRALKREQRSREQHFASRRASE